MINYWFTIIFLLLFSAVSAQCLTGREIMELSDRLPKAETSSTLIAMTIYKEAKSVEKRFRMEMITMNDSERRSLISFDRPSSLKLLTYSMKNKADYQWLAMSSGKVKRITDAAKGKSFANSHFAYEDLAVKNIDDYRYRFLGEAFVDSDICFKVECIDIDVKERRYKSIYSTKILFPRKTDGFVKKIEFYERGQLVKYLVNYDIRLISGILTPMRIVMYDAENNDKTQLISTKAENNIKILRAKFNREAIKFKEY